MLWSSTEWKCLQRINRYMPDKPRTCCDGPRQGVLSAGSRAFETLARANAEKATATQYKSQDAATGVIKGEPSAEVSYEQTNQHRPSQQDPQGS